MTLVPRKRPRQQRATATVEAILEAAARILECDGLDVLTTNTVAERAGVSIGSLYQYFPGKHAILAELIRRERADLLAGIEMALSGAEPASLEAMIRSLTQAAVGHQLHRAHLARALEYAEATLPMAAETAALTDNVVARVQHLLATHGIENDGEAARDVVALAKGMIDAAGVAGESDENALANRVNRAVQGYLGVAR